MRFIKTPRARGFTLSLPIAASVHGWSKGRCAAISCLLIIMSKLECTASRIAGDVSRRKRKRSKEAPLENARRKLKMWKERRRGRVLKMGWTPLQVTDRHGKLIKNILIAIWSGDQSSKQEQCSRTPSRMAVPTAPTHALIPCSSHSIAYEWAIFSRSLRGM